MESNNAEKIRPPPWRLRLKYLSIVLIAKRANGADYPGRVRLRAASAQDRSEALWAACPASSWLERSDKAKTEDEQAGDNQADCVEQEEKAVALKSGRLTKALPKAEHTKQTGCCYGFEIWVASGKTDAQRPRREHKTDPDHGGNRFHDVKRKAF